MKRKTPAADRTVDMFSGRTNAEEQQPELSEEDTAEAKAPGEKTIEDAVDRYRSQAFVGQEWTSKLFPKTNSTNNSASCKQEEDFADAKSAQKSMQITPSPSGKVPVTVPVSSFRLSLKSGWMYLEELRLGTNGLAYHYAGVMFPEESLEELARVLVQCVRDRKRASGATS